MKNIYIQGTCAPDSVLEFKVFTLHSLCAQFQGDYLMIKFLDFNYHYYLYSWAKISRSTLSGPSKEFHIKSEGCEDPNVKQMENTCGFTYIKVNGIDFSLHGRGCNVVVVDGRTGKKKTAESLTH